MVELLYRTAIFCQDHGVRSAAFCMVNSNTVARLLSYSVEVHAVNWA